uniref:Uncharacterized protein n=1 Tax=Pipistrellus kuhlii TaxID=59472 RepID=A0A7J7YM81_PIPKU|nr:hypothetical protein mPipKuh1_010144 [Pipistrellus kuhlii]
MSVSFPNCREKGSEEERQPSLTPSRRILWFCCHFGKAEDAVSELPGRGKGHTHTREAVITQRCSLLSSYHVPGRCWRLCLTWHKCRHFPGLLRLPGQTKSTRSLAFRLLSPSCACSLHPSPLHSATTWPWAGVSALTTVPPREAQGPPPGGHASTCLMNSGLSRSSQQPYEVGIMAMPGARLREPETG